MNEPAYDFPLSELVSNGQWRWAIEPRFTAQLGVTGGERRFFCDRALTASHSEDGYLFGYLDLTGAEVIPPQFRDAKTFESGRAWVEQNARWGLIDASGSFLTRPMYDWIDGSIGAGTGGLRAVRLADRLGYVDETGALVINPRFGYDSGGFSEGFSSVSLWSSEDEVTPYGVIDSSGNWVVQPRFSDIWSFSRGLAAARLEEDSKWGFIDSSGSWIISPAFDWAAEFDAHGLARVQKDGLWGVIDTEGRFIIQPQFDAIDDFVDGIAGVSIGDGMNARMGFIDISGKFVIPPRFATVYGFNHGYAKVYEDDADDVWNSFSIDRTGERVANFRSCEEFSEGLAFARSHDGSVGVIDTTGDWIVEPVLPFLSQMGPFGCGAAVLESWGPDGPHLHHEWVGYIALNET